LFFLLFYVEFNTIGPSFPFDPLFLTLLLPAAVFRSFTSAAAYADYSEAFNFPFFYFFQIISSFLITGFRRRHLPLFLFRFIWANLTPSPPVAATFNPPFASTRTERRRSLARGDQAPLPHLVCPFSPPRILVAPCPFPPPLHATFSLFPPNVEGSPDRVAISCTLPVLDPFPPSSLMLLFRSYRIDDRNLIAAFPLLLPRSAAFPLPCGLVRSGLSRQLVRRKEVYSLYYSGPLYVEVFPSPTALALRLG